MRSKYWIAAIALAGLLGTFQGLASEVLLERPPDPTGDRLLRMGGFLDSHPDLRFRLLGGARFWEPEQYQAWHDTMWEWSVWQAGRVTVGELEIPDASKPEPPDQEN